MQKFSKTTLNFKQRTTLQRLTHHKAKPKDVREKELKEKSRIPNPWRKIIPSDMILAQGKEALNHPVPENMRYFEIID